MCVYRLKKGSALQIYAKTLNFYKLSLIKNNRLRQSNDTAYYELNVYKTQLQIISEQP